MIYDIFIALIKPLEIALEIALKIALKIAMKWYPAFRKQSKL